MSPFAGRSVRVEGAERTRTAELSSFLRFAALMREPKWAEAVIRIAPYIYIWRRRESSRMGHAAMCI